MFMRMPAHSILIGRGGADSARIFACPAALCKPAPRLLRFIGLTSSGLYGVFYTPCLQHRGDFLENFYGEGNKLFFIMTTHTRLCMHSFFFTPPARRRIVPAAAAVLPEPACLMQMTVDAQTDTYARAAIFTPFYALFTPRPQVFTKSLDRCR
ncbi:MAG TPA: hypothetical protein VGP06_18470 [Janthinobacterium sp.]|nr:hypothetical protein [Janthinobacterium sp.]